MYYISQYRVDDQPVNEGGMGRILHGYDPDGNEVAIKEILPEYAADIEMRFRINKEMMFLNRLEGHKSIVKTYESFMLLDKFYIAMEFVHGQNIEQWVKTNGVYDEKDAIRVMTEVLDVMQFVHENEVVHRDLKPSNIMIRDNGDVCLLDFGIAKDMSSNASNGTMAGTIIGSDGYMSPEQAMAMDLDCRSDIYSLGCVLYFMLTGQHAFPTDVPEAEMLLAITDKPFPKARAINKNVSRKMDAVIQKATDKNMAHRYQSCKEFADALLAINAPNKPGTNVSGSHTQGKCYLTLGREGCDVVFDDPNYKVSRHHAEIELKVFTGGAFYIFRDDSSNGSLVNGNLIHHMSYHIPMEGPLPEILLAGDPAQKVDWEEVIEMLNERKKQMESEMVNQPENPVGPTQLGDPFPPVDPPLEDEEPPKMFSRIFAVSGRIRRLEYDLTILIVYVILIGAITGLVLGGVKNPFIFAGLGLVATIIPVLQGIKRCHDVNHSGWWLLIPFYSVILFFLDGDPYRNDYGDDPKGR